MADRLMLNLPDGKEIEVLCGTTVLDALREGGWVPEPSAMVADVSGHIIELNKPLYEGGNIELLSFEQPRGREAYRHTASHVMAQAVRRLHPDVKLAIGPAIEDGFYYDFALPENLSADDLPAIEGEMSRIITEDLPIARKELSRVEAIELFKNRGEVYKVELIEDLEDEAITVYEQGEFVDLCRGPHLTSTGKIKAFRLLSIAS